jgi:hypothetical protein
MRLARVRFTIAQLMVLVAVTGVYLGLYGPPSAVDATHLALGSIAAAALACLFGLLLRSRARDGKLGEPRDGPAKQLTKRPRRGRRVMGDI